MFEGAGLPLPAVPIQCGSVITIRELLIGSDFLTLLSPDQMAVKLAAGWLTIVRPAPPDIVRTIGITTRGNWTPTPLQRSLVAEIEIAGGESRS